MEGWLDTPIFILNFNQLAFVRRQIDWLLNAGYRNVTVLDNDSTYPPLLRYYDEVTARRALTVVRRAHNDDKVTVWNEHLGELEGPFVLTSSDVVPDENCPADVVGHLARHLYDNPRLVKVGRGLRVDDVPARYRHRREVLLRQTEWWRAPAACGLFLAPIDSTFALYRRGSPYALYPAGRTGWPYRARHLPWYADSAHPTEEERYYASTLAPDRGTWGRDRLPDWIVASCEELAAAPRPTLVHLACGREILPGWVNADGADDVGADVVFDLGRCADERLPIGDDRVDGFFMGHAFAGIEATRAMLEELYRVARRDAKLVIRLPQATSSPERPARRYRLDTFAEWGQPGRAADWKVERVKLVVAPDVADTRAVADIAARMGTEANVVREIVVHLRAVKPPRAGDPRRLDAAAISVVSSPPDEDSRF